MTHPQSVQTPVDARAQYLTFYVGGEAYGIALLRVREIVEHDTLTRVPKSPQYLRGVLNLRGRIVPVVDLAMKFGLPESVVTKTTCIVIVELAVNGEQVVIGLMADSVTQVLELSPGDLEPPPAFGTEVTPQCLVAMGRVGRGFVLILDIDRVLAGSETMQAAAVPVVDARASVVDG
jgi:purine-binding chemotaxis protein CheW